MVKSTENTMTTKQLALELGLVRKRRLKSANEQNKRKKSAQVFAYLLVVDFESTCWEKKQNTSNEIRCQEFSVLYVTVYVMCTVNNVDIKLTVSGNRFEFPAVLLNTETGSIEEEFHYYVQPVDNPTLSDFCTNLTGITQEQVDEGIPLSLCLKKFNTWMNKLADTKGFSFGAGERKCSVVTWSDWDIGTCLFYECRRKQLRVPPSMVSWIDLRATYRKFYERKPNGLNGALQDLGIEFEGREHSGIIDARNTVKLTWKMICDGCVMQTTKSLPDKFRSDNTTTFAPHTEVKAIVEVVAANNGSDVLLETKCASLKLQSCQNSLSLHDQVRKKFSTVKEQQSVDTMKMKDQDNNLRDGCALSSNSKSCDTFKTPVQRVSSTVCSTTDTNSSVKYKFVTPILSDTRRHTHLKTRGHSGTEHLHTSLVSTGHSKNLSVVSSSKVTPFSTYHSGRQYSVTPPMCNCGRRTHKKFVQSPGSNLGRCFYSCPHGWKGQSGTKTGCGFFKWETEVFSSCKQILDTVRMSVGSLGTGTKRQLAQPDFDLTL